MNVSFGDTQPSVLSALGKMSRLTKCIEHEMKLNERRPVVLASGDSYQKVIDL